MSTTDTLTGILPVSGKCKVRSKIEQLTKTCDSYHLSHFAAFFIEVGTKTSIAENVEEERERKKEGGRGKKQKRAIYLSSFPMFSEQMSGKRDKRGAKEAKVREKQKEEKRKNRQKGPFIAPSAL